MNNELMENRFTDTVNRTVNSGLTNIGLTDHRLTDQEIYVLRIPLANASILCTALGKITT